MSAAAAGQGDGTRVFIASARQAGKTEALRRAKSPSSLLLPYQRRWIADQSEVKVCEKSRRVGLTWAEAADRALTAAAANGRDGWYIGYNKDMALEFIETVAMWAKAFDAAASVIEDAGDVLEQSDRDAGVLAFRVRFASGHKVVALSSRPSNLRGKQGDVVIDEAAFHPDLAELIKAAIALTMWGGRIRIISTHDGDENPFNEIVNDTRAGRVKYSLHRITIDEALADGLYQRICEKLKKPWSIEAEREWRENLFNQYRGNADEELLCIPRSGGGAYLPGALVEARMQGDVPVIRLAFKSEFSELPKAVREAEVAAMCQEHLASLLATLNPNLLSVFGEDFGRSGDLTVIWPLQLRQDLVRVTPFLVELRNCPFEQQWQILRYIVDRLPRFFAGKLDKTGNGAYLAEVARQRYGSGRIEEVHLSQEWYRENFPPYKAAIEDAAVLLPRDADVLADHRAIRMLRGVATVPDKHTTGGDGGKRHADSVVAGVLAYAASRAEPAEYDYQPAFPHRGDDDDFDDREPARSGLAGLRGAY